jgi:hypothetical protein
MQGKEIFLFERMGEIVNEKKRKSEAGRKHVLGFNATNLFTSITDQR